MEMSGLLNAAVRSAPGKEVNGTHRRGGWVASGAGPENLEKRKILTAIGIWTPDIPCHGHHTFPAVPNVLTLQKIVSRILELNRNPQDTIAHRPSVFKLEYIGFWS